MYIPYAMRIHHDLSITRHSSRSIRLDPSRIDPTELETINWNHVRSRASNREPVFDKISLEPQPRRIIDSLIAVYL